jgi:hypothetical protein
MVTLMITPVAINLGALAYGEKLPLSAYGGFALLALGLLVLNGKVKLPGLAPRAAPTAPLASNPQAPTGIAHPKAQNTPKRP